MANPETRLQIVVVQYLRTILPAGAVFWSVPNGGKMTATARKLAAAIGEYPGGVRSDDPAPGQTSLRHYVSKAPSRVQEMIGLDSNPLVLAISRDGLLKRIW